MELLILYAVLSIFFSFLCSILEAALLSFTPSFIKINKQEGNGFADTLAEFKKDIDKPLIAILTVNTIAHTVGAIMVGVQAEKAFGDGTNAVMIVSVIMTLAILVLSEIIPKTIGATYWQSLGKFTATSLRLLIFPLKYTGILWLMMLTTKAIGKSAHVSTMSREEFIAIADVAGEEGVFEENETTIIKNLLIFKSIQAKDVMTPFSVAKIEDEEMTIEDFFHANRNLKFSRIPVYKDSPNNISGFILKDDLLEEMIDEKGPEPLSSLQRDLPAITGDVPIPVLFDNFIKKRIHIAMVVDEFGNTIGLVTMEDIIETLLGLEIMDESDSVEDMQKLARKKWEERAKRMGILSFGQEDSEEVKNPGTSDNSENKE
ncbi:CNNM domain-containing protein [Salinimicrobium terrae]|uniref:CNNM domain-containing protein n=1 Tax=Salinimicrobium terrae TaxID=470866 RepID=UPI0004086649|nr:CNNM domain-containing protein [Salinimicrobium terrae]